MAIAVTRLPLHLTPDPSRVITRLFFPGDTNRIREIVTRILELPETEVVTLLAELERVYGSKHPDLLDVFTEHYEQACGVIPVEINSEPGADVVHRRLFHDGVRHRGGGAVQSLDRPRVDFRKASRPGAVRFLMSLRATGEGHISSIVFRTGIDRRQRRCSARRTQSLQPRRSRRLCPTTSISRPFDVIWPHWAFRLNTMQRILDRLGDRLHARSALRGDRRGATGSRNIRLPGRDGRHSDFADPSELPAPPGAADHLSGVRDRHLPVLGHRTAWHRGSTAGAIHRR